MKLNSIRGLPVLDKKCAPLVCPEDYRAATQADSFTRMASLPL